LRVVTSEAAEFLTEGSQRFGTLPVAPADVWEVLPGVYEELAIPVTEVRPHEMTLGNPAYETRRIDGARMSRFLDCGATHSGILANIYDVTLTLSTTVSESPEGDAVVTHSLDAWARPRMTSGNPVHCSSKGTLEERLMEVILERLPEGTHASTSTRSRP
jgi:hypothetical protein